MRTFKTNIDEMIEQLQKVKAAVGGTGSTPPDFSDAMFGALNTGMALMKRRIFNLSQDANSEPLGKYIGKKKKITRREFTRFNSEDPNDVFVKREARKKKKRLQKNADASGLEEFSHYEKKRLAHGRQIEKKDLEFDGTLRRTIEVVKEVNRVVIAFTNTEQAAIARYQEQQIGNIRAGANPVKGKATPVRIFSLSEEEYEQVREQGKRGIVETIKKIIREQKK